MFADRTKRNLKREWDNSLLAKIGLACVLLILIMAIFAPLLAPHDPTSQSLGDRNTPPVGFGTADNPSTLDHPLGTDPLGRDLLSRIMYGARTSLLVALFSTLAGAAFGVTAGLFSGYYRGWFDDLVMRSVDIALAIPGIILAVTLIGVLGPMPVRIPDPFVMIGLTPDMPKTFIFPGTVSIAIAVLSWNEFARISRGETLSVREEEYVKAAKSMGASDGSIVKNHLFPNTFTPVLVFWAIRIATAILIESTLSFLGFSGTTLSWGYDIAVGRDYLNTAWWVASLPGLAIVIAVIGINLIGDWFRDALDPSLESEGRGV